MLVKIEANIGVRNWVGRLQLRRSHKMRIGFVRATGLNERSAKLVFRHKVIARDF